MVASRQALRERLAQIGQAAAEIVVGLRLLAVRPEGSGQELALHLATGAQRQQRKQIVSLPRTQRRQGFAIDLDIEHAEQAQLQGGHPLDFYSP